MSSFAQEEGSSVEESTKIYTSTVALILRPRHPITLNHQSTIVDGKRLAGVRAMG